MVAPGTVIPPWYLGCVATPEIPKRSSLCQSHASWFSSFRHLARDPEEQEREAAVEPGGWIKGTWVLALTLGVTATSCTLQGRGQGPRPLPASEPAVATKATVQAAYGNLPLSFEANEGQSDAQVQFLARGHGYSLFLTPTEAVLTLPNAER